MTDLEKSLLHFISKSETQNNGFTYLHGEFDISIGDYDPCTGVYDVSTAAGFNLKYYTGGIEVDPSTGKIKINAPFAIEKIIEDNLHIVYEQYGTIEQIPIKFRPDLVPFLETYVEEDFLAKDIVNSLLSLENQQYIQRYNLVCCITNDGSLFISENPLVPLDGSTHFTSFEQYSLRTPYL